MFNGTLNFQCTVGTRVHSVGLEKSPSTDGAIIHERRGREGSRNNVRLLSRYVDHSRVRRFGSRGALPSGEERISRTDEIPRTITADR